MWDRVSFVREFREARAVAKLVSTSGKRETSDSNQIQNRIEESSSSVREIAPYGNTES